MKEKFDKLKQYLRELDKQGLCLAFSGGIDSCALLYLCKDLNVIAVTFKSIFQTEQEINEAKEFCNFYGIKQKIIEYYPLENNLIKNNPKDRCYHCKKLIFSELKRYAGNKIIIDGTNADDIKTYRPGLKALKELGIYSPFADFGITKKRNHRFFKRRKYKELCKTVFTLYGDTFPI
ncbi:TPA: 7-cyano-7-deazaguanine synthase [Candidatus Avigastranaerophilus faecigallinarum]|nr:7-cyano-7-deazaguanine synthase [Candidatus Avigastranaerophilus faecigallinarum]